jgi:hypothetical protein
MIALKGLSRPPSIVRSELYTIGLSLAAALLEDLEDFLSSLFYLSLTHFYCDHCNLKKEWD